MISNNNYIDNSVFFENLSCSYKTTEMNCFLRKILFIEHKYEFMDDRFGRFYFDSSYNYSQDKFRLKKNYLDLYIY